MNKRATIKIIKRDQREVAKSVGPKSKATSGNDSAREIISTVTGWVHELQQKRQAETVRAYKNLFKGPLAGPSGA